MVDRMRETHTEVAEGGRDSKVTRDPKTPLKTATTPVVKAAHSIAATGKLRDITMSAEGTENPDNHEGVRLNSDETIPANPKARSQVAIAAELGRKPNILIVEDTAELAEVIQATLENRGMNVDWVSHGSKGVERIKKESPDVLLLDIGLPDMTGWKMLEELREWKKDPDNLPAVVVITAYGDPANRLIGKLQGIHSYLIKPFTSDEVEKVVYGALTSAK